MTAVVHWPSVDAWSPLDRRVAGRHAHRHGNTGRRRRRAHRRRARPAGQDVERGHEDVGSVGRGLAGPHAAREEERRRCDAAEEDTPGERREDEWVAGHGADRGGQSDVAAAERPRSEEEATRHVEETEEGATHHQAAEGGEGTHRRQRAGDEAKRGDASRERVRDNARQKVDDTESNQKGCRYGEGAARGEGRQGRTDGDERRYNGGGHGDHDGGTCVQGRTDGRRDKARDDESRHEPTGDEEDGTPHHSDHRPSYCKNTPPRGILIPRTRLARRPPGRGHL